jgi:hypothetical protein
MHDEATNTRLLLLVDNVITANSIHQFSNL